MPISKKCMANSFAKFYVRRELGSRRTRSRRTLVRSGCNFFPRTNFLANRSPVRGGVRANSGEPGRTPPNSGERSAYSGERSPEFGGVSVLANRWRIRAEFTRVRSSSPEFARVRGERQFAEYTAHKMGYFYQRTLNFVSFKISNISHWLLHFKISNFSAK